MFFLSAMFLILIEDITVSQKQGVIDSQMDTYW